MPLRQLCDYAISAYVAYPIAMLFDIRMSLRTQALTDTDITRTW